MKRIVYCIAGTYNSGGMERVLANKANWLVNNGYEVSIITTDQQGRQSFFAFDSRIRMYDLEINYEDNNGKSFLNKLIWYPYKQYKHKRRLKTLLLKLKADVVISMFCNEASILTKIKDGSKKVIEIHFSRFKRQQYGRQGIWRIADKLRSVNDLKIVSRYDRFVVLTEEDKGYWQNLDNLCVIPNARSFIVEKPIELDKHRVLAVGRYCHQKSFDRLLQAWKIVCDHTDGWTLRIVGDGEDIGMLQELINKLSLSNKVILGRPEVDMESVYKEASILAMSSRYEGLPMVLLEAQAVGLPIVSFACKCGPKDVISDGIDGFLIPEGDINALAGGLMKLMDDKQLRVDMGRQAYLNSKRFDEAVIMDKWVDLFDSLDK